MQRITVLDLAPVAFSAGRAFEGASASRLDTENFLRSGNLAGVTSRSDLALLEDLRDVAQYVVEHAGDTVDASYVRTFNATITRSGALHPGERRAPTRHRRSDQVRQA